jgi:hypothetical protein
MLGADDVGWKLIKGLEHMLHWDFYEQGQLDGINTGN